MFKRSFISLALLFALPMTSLAQDNAEQATQAEITDEVIVTGKVRGGDDAMSAFLRGDYATAEIEFKKNFSSLIRIENLNANAFIQAQNDQLNATIQQGPPQAGSQGGAPQTTTPTSFDVRGLNQFNKNDSENTLTSGNDKGYQLYMAGLSQIQLGKYEEAKTNFNRAIRLNKKLYDARARLGLIYLSEANYDKAAEQLMKLDKLRQRCSDWCKDKDNIREATLVLAKELAR